MQAQNQTRWKMKKLITLLLILTMTLALSSCWKNNDDDGNDGGEGGGNGNVGDTCIDGGKHNFVENRCTKCGRFFDPEGWT